MLVSPSGEERVVEGADLVFSGFAHGMLAGESRAPILAAGPIGSIRSGHTTLDVSVCRIAPEGRVEYRRPWSAAQVTPTMRRISGANAADSGNNRHVPRSTGTEVTFLKYPLGCHFVSVWKRR